MKSEHGAVGIADGPPGWLTIVGIAAIATGVVFYKLGSAPVFWWDEARVALNSLEMMRHPGLIVRYQGEADLWNTKPPLLIWLNALSMRLFGVNEWALRLPSALAAIGTVIATYRFAERVADRSTGILTALILLGIGGYIEVHVARSADFDSLLVLFTTLATFSLFFAFETKRFWPPAAWGAAAVLTKGVAGAMMAPGFAIYALVARKDVRGAIFPALCAAGVVVLFYAAREAADPGYIRAVWASDVMRYSVPAEGNTGATNYVVGLLWPWQMLLPMQWEKPAYLASAFPWSWVALLALFRPSRAAVYLFCCTASFLLIVSLAATQLNWYVAPVHPLIAVLAALGIRGIKADQGFALSISFALAAVCVWLNLWKIEKTVAVPPPHFDFRTPDGRSYRGPAEFYEAVPHLRRKRQRDVVSAPHQPAL